MEKTIKFWILKYEQLRGIISNTQLTKDERLNALNAFEKELNLVKKEK